jgi:hypothetical protein
VAVVRGALRVSPNPCRVLKDEVAAPDEDAGRCRGPVDPKAAIGLMAKVIVGMTTSLDGFVADRSGSAGPRASLSFRIKERSGREEFGGHR